MPKKKSRWVNLHQFQIVWMSSQHDLQKQTGLYKEPPYSIHIQYIRKTHFVDTRTLQIPFGYAPFIVIY
jgi:hypothetical protein